MALQRRGSVDARRSSSLRRVAIYELTSLYVLADQYDMVSLKQYAMRMLFDTIKRSDGSFWQDEHVRPYSSHIIYVYENTVRGSPLRKFVAAHWAWHRSLASLADEKSWERLAPCPEFAFDMARLLASRAIGGPDPLLDITPFLNSTQDGSTHDHSGYGNSTHASSIVLDT